MWWLKKMSHDTSVIILDKSIYWSLSTAGHRYDRGKKENNFWQRPVLCSSWTNLWHIAQSSGSQTVDWDTLVGRDVSEDRCSKITFCIFFMNIDTSHWQVFMSKYFVDDIIVKCSVLLLWHLNSIFEHTVLGYILGRGGWCINSLSGLEGLYLQTL